MKKWYVYELVNLMGTIEYVGETYDIKQRLYNHTKTNKSIWDGKFYGRNDIFMNIVAEFDNNKDAFEYQCKLQKEYGFETDLDKMQYSIKKAYEKLNKPILCFDYKSNKFLAEFSSQREASRILNVNNIDKVLKGTINHTKGYRFEYKLNEE